MNWILSGIVVSWLSIISWFDLRKGEIPHSGWVITPLIIAVIYRAILGDFSLVALTILIIFASEREKIADLCNFDNLGTIKTYIPGLLLSLFWTYEQNLIGALAMIGFWVAWELHWWGGADAVAAITLCLIWPTVDYLLAFLLMNTLSVVFLTIFSLIKEGKAKFHKIPGLPLLLFAVLFLQLTKL